MPSSVALYHQGRTDAGSSGGSTSSGGAAALVAAAVVALAALGLAGALALLRRPTPAGTVKPGPNSTSSANCGSAAGYYPGHAYVDLLGLSAYRPDGATVASSVIAPMSALFDAVPPGTSVHAVTTVDGRDMAAASEH